MAVLDRTVNKPATRGGRRSRLSVAARVLGAVVCALLTAQLLVALHIVVTMARVPEVGTKFMDRDRRYAVRLDPSDTRRRQLESPVYQWMSLGSASQDALLVILSREDQLLVSRPLAFDPEQFVERAWSWLFQNADGDPSGSTIPQQVAKNLFTDGERSAWRKAYEANYALLLNEIITKQEMLEIYINIIEFGPGIYGLCAASHYYFDKAPSELSRWEAATLVGLMPSPKTFTIYPTSPTVIFARHNADRYVGMLRAGTDPKALAALLPEPAAQPDCQAAPESLVQRLAATSDAHGVPLIPGDQWWWARVTCQYKHGVLPDWAKVSLKKVRRLARYTLCLGPRR